MRPGRRRASRLLGGVGPSRSAGVHGCGTQRDVLTHATEPHTDFLSRHVATVGSVPSGARTSAARVAASAVRGHGSPERQCKGSQRSITRPLAATMPRPAAHLALPTAADRDTRGTTDIQITRHRPLATSGNPLRRPDARRSVDRDFLTATGLPRTLDRMPRDRHILDGIAD